MSLDPATGAAPASEASASPSASSSTSPATPPAPALAAVARSVLSCPAEVQLVVDGVEDVTAGLAGDSLGMQDLHGRPTFSCPAGSALAEAGIAGRSALLTLTSGLGISAAGRAATLTLSGRLVATGEDLCECCEEVRVTVVLDLNFALLGRADHPEGRQYRIPVEAFASPAHDLNRGFLQRSVEHANECHQAELRRAVSTMTGTRVAEVVGVALSGLEPDRVDLAWVDPTGAHRRRLTFATRATTPGELGDLLRRELHAGLC